MFPIATVYVHWSRAVNGAIVKTAELLFYTRKDCLAGSPPHYLFTFLGFVSLFAGCHAHVYVGRLFNHAHADVGMAPGGEGKEFNRSNHEKCESDDRNDGSVCHAAGCKLRRAQDWPQWRGPNRDAKATGFKAPKAWPKELTQKWKVTVGEGVASPALVCDKFEPSDKEFKAIAKYKVASGDTYAYPVVAGNRVLVKDRDSLILYTID